MSDIIDVISQLLGLDLSVYNQDLVFLVCAVFLFLVVSFVYELLMMIFGYIGGKRR